MKQMLNRGFSLVEVMLIFLICSLILAASVPFITRKSRAIPSKISHGMYRCYSNGTNFTEEYYNSYSMVSSNNVAECKFKIPASATVFKIDLIGAGAGGHEYYKVEDSEESISGQYHISGGFSGKAYQRPSDVELKKYFSGLRVKLCQYAPNAQAGQSLKYSRFSPGNFNCRGIVNQISANNKQISALRSDKKFFESNKTQIKALESANIKLAEASKMVAEYASKYENSMQNDFLTNELSNYCASQGWGEGIVIASESRTIKGGSGGKGGYIDVSFDIGEGKPNQSFESYLSGLLTKDYLKGRCPAAGCSEASFQQASTVATTQSAGTYAIPEGVSDTGIYAGKSGADVEYLAAIKTPDGIVTHTAPSTGGEAAALQVYTSSINELPGAAGESATSQLAISCNEIKPYISISTNINIKEHYTGHGGGAGDYKTVYSYGLSGDEDNNCRIKISHGGSPAQFGVEPEEDLSTSIVCGDYHNSVNGGSYKLSSVNKKSYHLVQYLSSIPDMFKTLPESGEGSKYNTNMFWLKYKVPAMNIGAGGNGSGIIDKCTEPHGTYNYTLNNGYRGSSKYNKSENFNFNRNCTNDSTFVSNIPATKGQGGGVVIVW